MKIACIGSRVTPPIVLSWMEKIGEALVKAGHTIVSGNAPGADQAWACGGNRADPSKVELHLPWSGFEKQFIHKNNVVIVFANLKSEDQDIRLKVAAGLHGGWHNCSQGAQKLLGRNHCIIEQASCVYGYLNPKKLGGGGTGMAFKMAEFFNIPTFNVAKPDIQDQITKEYL